MRTMLADLSDGLTRLPKSLAEIVHGEFIVAEGCYFVSSLYTAKGNANLSRFPDKTGYECYVNHIHLDDHDANTVKQLEMAIAAMKVLRENWRNWEYSHLPIEFVISVDESSCVFRFHVLRDNEKYLDGDLEKYENDAVLVSISTDDDY
jgi:hypothetical protein